jgi:hypothetical protein
MSPHLPFIVIEVVLVFGGALAFAWWQFRDLRREREKREQRQRAERARQAPQEPDDAA